jgi:DNA-binding beta-propeller fold protein YncE/gas vesicle protein
MLENHQDCKEVTVLENIIKNVKTSNMFNEIERLIDELIETIVNIRQNRETNASVVKEQKILVENEIRELRNKIDKHLEKLQEDVMMELTEAEKQVTEDTRELLVFLDEKQTKLTEHQTNIVNIKKYASDLQTCLAGKQIEKDVETQGTCLQSIFNSDSLIQTKLSYKIDSGLKTIANIIQRFGEVVVNSKPFELTFVRRKDKQAHMMVADLSPPIPVENIQLKLKQRINIKGKCIRGCSLLPDGRMAMSCRQTKTVSFINKDGEEYFKISRDKKRSCTFDTAYIKHNNSVAVSSGDGNNRCIAIIGIQRKKVITTISIDTDSYGMAVRGKSIYYCTQGNGLKMLNLSDNSVSDIISSSKANVNYVATSGEKLYYTHWYTDTVTCCNLDGTTQWDFKDERVLRGAVGISVDNDGNVYVVGYNSNNVVVISPDGQYHRQLLSFKNGLVTPSALDYDKSTERLLVVNQSSTAFLFDVTSEQ